ncbi:hypothetical protein EWH08_19830 [Sphingobium indicum]|uniref:Uncharacterized protein n=1 Tax=Sphingobium indicum TaxID=332055 RepID=A0A4Q4ITG8_9SPHN|nr:hypothetical protein EWH08_19830 [Sphingobium indicum]
MPISSVHSNTPFFFAPQRRTPCRVTITLRGRQPDPPVFYLSLSSRPSVACGDRRSSRMSGPPNFDGAAACRADSDKIGSPTPRRAAATGDRSPSLTSLTAARPEEGLIERMRHSHGGTHDQLHQLRRSRQLHRRKPRQ